MTQFLDTPVDKSLTAFNAWTDIDLSSDVPEGATGGIFRIHNTYSSARKYGLRKKGSTNDKFYELHGYQQAYAVIGLDANRKCQGKIESLNVDFYLVGYTEVDATLQTNETNKSLGTISTWTDIDLSANIPEGAVAAMFHVLNTNTGSGKEFGLRKNGSSDNRHNIIREGAHVFMIVGVDAARKCEGFINSTEVDFYLYGYLTMGQAETNAHNRSLGSTGSFIDIDESANAPSSATGVFGEVIQTLNNNSSVRKKGTSFDYYTKSLMHDGLLVGLDESKKWEGKISNTNLDFYTMGYFVASFEEKTKESSIGLRVVSRGTKASSIGLSIKDYGAMGCVMTYEGGSTYNDQTIYANNATINDVQPIFDTVGDILYCGDIATFGALKIKYSTKGVIGAGAMIIEYSKGSSVWGTLTCTDDADNFTEDPGTYFLSFTPPGDWATDTVDGKTNYWIRYRLTTNEYDVNPLLDQLWVLQTKTKISSIGLTIQETRTKESSIGVNVQEIRTKESSIGLRVVSRGTKASSIGLRVVSRGTKASSIGLTIYELVAKESSIGLSIQVEEGLTSSIGMRVVERKTKTSSIGMTISGEATKTSSIGLAITEEKTKASSIGLSIVDVMTKASSIGMQLVDQNIKESSIGLTVKGYPTKESTIGLNVVTPRSKTSSIGMNISGSNTLVSSIGLTVYEPVLQKGIFYGKLGDTILESVTPDNFRIIDEINKIPSFELEICNTEPNRAAIVAGISDNLGIYWQHHGVETLIFTGIINADSIEYISLTSIQISGYASYVKLGWPIYKHLMAEDAEALNMVYEFNGSFVDYTAEANNATINDIPVTFGDVNHGLYIGELNPFWGLQIKYSTKGAFGHSAGRNFDVVVADGTSEKEEVMPESDRCSNIFATDLYLEVPALTTPNKTVKIELLTNRDNVIFCRETIDAATAKKYHFPCSRALMNVTKYKITTDANVTGNKTFNVELRGINAPETSVVVIEYSKGNGIWATLDVLDETQAFTNEPGTYDVIIAHPPSDWNKNAVDGQERYWLRWRIESGSYSTVPKLDQMWMVNTDVYRVFYLAVSAREILEDVLEDTEYEMDAVDVCPEDEININAEYESPLRIVAGISNALTWTDSDGSKKSYQWWIDDAKKVHMKKRRGTTYPDDITPDLTIFNNLVDYFNLSNRLIGFSKRDGLSQIRAIVEDQESQNTHELRTLAIPKTQIGKYTTLKEALEKDIAISKAPLQRIKGSVQTEFWGIRGYHVGDTIKLHQSEWVVDDAEFQIVKAQIGPLFTTLDLGISQEHLNGFKADLQRRLNLNDVIMHGSTTLFNAGPETMNYERKADGEVFSAKLKMEIPSEVTKTHKMLLNWTIGNYRASVNEHTGEGDGHNHGGHGGAGGAIGSGYAGGGGAFTPDMLGDGGFTPQMLSEAHTHNLYGTLTIACAQGIFYEVVNDYVQGVNHRHSYGGSTGGPSSTANAVYSLNSGCNCSEACGGGSCITSTNRHAVGSGSHSHYLSGYTGYTSPNAYIETLPTHYVDSLNPVIQVDEDTNEEDPAHKHTGVVGGDHDHPGVYEGPHNDHLIPAEPAHDDHVIVIEPGGALDIEYGIHEQAAGTVLELLINEEKVGEYSGDQTEIRIDGFLSLGTNTVEIQPIAAETSKKGGATIWCSGILFIEPKKF